MAAEVRDDDRSEYDPKPHCMTCGGDGAVVCDGDVFCPEADDAGCPFIDFHSYTCDNCGGSGKAKDQRFW